MKSRFAFVVPLRNPSTTNDWSKTVRLCMETLHSLSRQGATPAEIILVCRDFPEIKTDRNVKVIRHPFPDPKTHADLRRDKYAKLKMAFVELRRRHSPFYVMKFDADDLVSARLAPWVLENANGRGYLVGSGYRMDMGSGRLFPVRTGFHRGCGSSNILFAEPEDLPLSMDDNSPFDLMRLGHHIVAKTFEDRGTPLDTIPFPACIYRTNHDENISANFPITNLSTERKPGWSSHFSRVLRRVAVPIKRMLEPKIDDELRAEFYLPRIRTR